MGLTTRRQTLELRGGGYTYSLQIERKNLQIIHNFEGYPSHKGWLEDHQRPSLQRQRQPERDEGDLLGLQQSVQQCDPGDQSPHNSQ